MSSKLPSVGVAHSLPAYAHHDRDGRIATDIGSWNSGDVFAVGTIFGAIHKSPFIRHGLDGRLLNRLDSDCGGGSNRDHL